MKKVIHSAAAAALALGFAASASAAVCLGNCGTMGADGIVTASPVGGDYQYVSTYGGLEGIGSLGVAGNEANGSLYVSDSFSASVGDALHFYFNYVTSDGGGFSDYAWAALRPADGGADILLFTARTTPTGNTVPGFGMPGLANGAALDPASTPIIPGAPTWSALGGDSAICFAPGCGYTDWIGMDYLFADAGVFSLVFGVTNVSDDGYNSGLAFAGLTINGEEIGGGGSTVPEPATLTLMLASLGLVGALRRRNKTPSA